MCYVHLSSFHFPNSFPVFFFFSLKKEISFLAKGHIFQLICFAEIKA